MLRLFLHAQQFIAGRLRDDSGQGLTEYALIITLVAVVAILALGFFGSKVTTLLSTAAGSV